MTTIEIAPVRGRHDLNTFIGLPYKLQRHDPHWVPPLKFDIRTRLSPKNPFFEHAAVEHFLARRGREVVGRVSAVHNRLHNEFHQDAVGFFGFFDAIDDSEVASRLFDAAADWLRGRDLGIIRGPTNLSTNDEAGLLIDGFHTPPVFMMPHNPPYYVSLVERSGFTKAKDLHVYQSTSDVLPERLRRATDLLAKRHNISTRRIDLKRFTSEVEQVKELYNQAWERNWGYVPMTEAEIDHLAKQFRPVVVPELVAFAEREGAPIGFALALPDLNVPLASNTNGALIPGAIRLLFGMRKVTRIRVLLLGVLPEWRGKGVDALLYRHIWDEGYQKGYRWAEAGWILEDNTVMSNGLTRMGFEVYKTYRLYDRPL